MNRHFSSDLKKTSKNKIIGIGVAAMIAAGIALIIRATRRGDFNSEMEKQKFDEIVKNVVNEYTEDKDWPEEQIDAIINKLQESWYELKM